MIQILNKIQPDWMLEPGGRTFNLSGSSFTELLHKPEVQRENRIRAKCNEDWRYTG
jgi:hypothetical protein